MTSVYFEDVPAAKPEFNYTFIARALADLLARKSDAATVVGIHGQWGSGKTTLMRAVERELRTLFTPAEAIFVEFNAWKYQERQALWRALILRVLGELRGHGPDDANLAELESSLYRSFSVEEKGEWRLNWRTLIIEAIGVLLSLVRLNFLAAALKKSTGFVGRLLTWASGGEDKSDSKKEEDKDKKSDEASPLNRERLEKLGSVLERTTVERQVVQVQSIEQFLGKFGELLAQPATGQRRVFVFIDDLDRCLPESALEVFEAIKLFLDVAGCGYVLALDRDVVRKGLAVKYSQQMRDGGGLFINADEYIEKTISVSYDLPRLSAADVRTIVRSFSLPVGLDAEHEQLIVAGLGSNPRRVKRFMNTLSVQLQLVTLLHRDGIPVEPCLVSFTADGAARRFDYFLKLSLLAYRYSGLFSLALQDASILRRLQRIGNIYANDAKEDPEKAREVRNRGIDSESALIWGLKTEEEFWILMAAAPNISADFGLTQQLLTWFRQVGPNRSGPTT